MLVTKSYIKNNSAVHSGGVVVGSSPATLETRVQLPLYPAHIPFSGQGPEAQRRPPEDVVPHRRCRTEEEETGRSALVDGSRSKEPACSAPPREGPRMDDNCDLYV